MSETPNQLIHTDDIGYLGDLVHRLSRGLKSQDYVIENLRQDVTRYRIDAEKAKEQLDEARLKIVALREQNGGG